MRVFTSLFFVLKHPLPGIDQLPENVDPGKREEFLNDAEFLEVSSNQSVLSFKTYLCLIDLKCVLDFYLILLSCTVNCAGARDGYLIFNIYVQVLGMEDV